MASGIITLDRMATPRLSKLSLSLLLFGAFIRVAAQVPPPNDFFTNAIPLTGSNGTAFGSNAGATLEPGEPQVWPFIGGASVWWTWTAPAAGIAAIDTFGSSFDTVLAVYRDVPIAAGYVPATYNDDGGGSPGPLHSAVRTPVEKGGKLYISVDGILGASGDIALYFALDPMPPRYFAQPQNATIMPGESATFSTTSTGGLMPGGVWTYQWRKDGVEIPGATNFSLVVANARFSDAGLYSVVIQNTLGSAVSANARLEVVPMRIWPPEDQSLSEGYDAVYRATIMGPPTTFQWLRDGVEIPGATNNTWSITNAGRSDSGSVFSVRIANEWTNLITAPARLTVTPPYTFTTLAGRAGMGGSNDGPRQLARFNSPHGIAVDHLGCVYVTEVGNSVIRRISPSGMVSTLAGAPGQRGNLDGLGAAARFSEPWGIAVDGNRNLYVADTGGQLIRKITPEGLVTTLAGTGKPGARDGSATNAQFWIPADLVVDPAGNVYVADAGNHRIRQLTPEGVVSTFAGAGLPGNFDGLRPKARFSGPVGIGLDSEGNFYIADESNSRLRKITPVGLVTTLAGDSAKFSAPHGAKPDREGNVYVADYLNCTVRRVAPDGAVTTLAGEPRRAGTADGAGRAARFSQVRGVAVDAWGNLYITDYDNHTIRKGWRTDAALPPRFTLHPLPQTVPAGSNVVLTAAAGGTGLISFQWWLDGQPLPGETNDSLVIPSARPEHSGVYHVAVANQFGSVTSDEALVRVAAPEVVLRTPEVLPGGTVRLQFTEAGGGAVPALLKAGIYWRADLPMDPADTNWNLLSADLFLTNGFVAVDLTNALVQPARFYRVKLE
jgi:sugar lactone lactonase YvrE